MILPPPSFTLGPTAILLVMCKPRLLQRISRRKSMTCWPKESLSPCSRVQWWCALEPCIRHFALCLLGLDATTEPQKRASWTSLLRSAALLPLWGCCHCGSLPLCSNRAAPGVESCCCTGASTLGSSERKPLCHKCLDKCSVCLCALQLDVEGVWNTWTQGLGWGTVWPKQGFLQTFSLLVFQLSFMCLKKYRLQIVELFFFFHFYMGFQKGLYYFFLSEPQT